MTTTLLRLSQIASLAAFAALPSCAGNGSETGDLQASTHSLMFVTSVGGSTAEQLVVLTSATDREVTFSTTTSPAAPWLACTPEQGTTPVTQTCSADIRSLASGSYSTTRTVRNNANPEDSEVITVTLVVGAGPPVPGIEQRCSDLQNDGDSGTNCVCSEILNYSQPRQNGVANPASASSFECAPQYGGNVIDSNAYFSSVPGASVGLASVAQVIQIEKDTGGLTDFHGPNIDLSSKTLCERAYYKYSPGHISPPSLMDTGDNTFKGHRWMNSDREVENSSRSRSKDRTKNRNSHARLPIAVDSTEVCRRATRGSCACTMV